MMIQVGSSSAMPMSFTMWGWSSFFISTVGRPRQTPLQWGETPSREPKALSWGVGAGLCHGAGAGAAGIAHHSLVRPQRLLVSSSPGIYIPVVVPICSPARIWRPFSHPPPVAIPPINQVFWRTSMSQGGEGTGHLPPPALSCIEMVICPQAGTRRCQGRVLPPHHCSAAGTARPPTSLVLGGGGTESLRRLCAPPPKKAAGPSDVTCFTQELVLVLRAAVLLAGLHGHVDPLPFLQGEGEEGAA